MLQNRSQPEASTFARSTFLLLAGLVLAAMAPAAVGQAPPSHWQLRGLPLAEALARLDAETSIQVLFSENLVRPDMSVTEEPASEDPEAVLRLILAPHGLTVRDGPGNRFVVVRAEPDGRITGLVRRGVSGEPLAGANLRIVGTEKTAVSALDGRFEFEALRPGTYDLEARLTGFRSTRAFGVEVTAGASSEIRFELPIIAFEEIVITPSLISVSREDPAPPLRLDAAVLRRLPVAGDDVLRSASLLPGIASNDFSAELNLRGGRPDEVLVLLDGLELFEPYHLKDFENALGIVPSEAIEKLDLSSGGFTAAYGDRMSGVLDMTTLGARSTLSGKLSAGLIHLGATAIDHFPKDRGQWMFSGRRGTLEHSSQLAEEEERPEFWDVFAKISTDITPSQSLWLRALQAGDEFDLDQISSLGSEDVRTGYTSSYQWLTHSALLGEKTLLETRAFSGRIHQDRRGAIFSPSLDFEVADRRLMNISGFEHQGTWHRAPAQYLQWGVAWRELDTRYDYSKQESRAIPFDSPSAQPQNDFHGRIVGRQLGLFVANRWQPWDRLTLEVGLRFDENEFAEDNHTSPRFNLALATGRSGSLRLAWGHYYQSQRAYELQVEDGVTSFFPDEKSTQAVVAYELALRPGLQLRLEAYDRLVLNPRPRFENLLDPTGRFPEVAPDRTRLDPQRARSRGLEVLLRRDRARINWWASYAYSSTEDEIAGTWVNRSIDQPHAALASVAYLVSPAWSFGLTGSYHTGWPRTPFTLQVESTPSTSLVPVFGPLYSRRFDDYVRLDFRAGRTWRSSRHPIELSVDVFNLANNVNLRGFGVPAAAQLGSSPADAPLPKAWLGRAGNVTLSWRF